MSTNDKNRRAPAPLYRHVSVTLAVICGLLGVMALWDVVAPPSMTAHCAHLIEENPPENFSFISPTAREETLRCLHVQWRYGQQAWKIDPKYNAR